MKIVFLSALFAISLLLSSCFYSSPPVQDVSYAEPPGKFLTIEKDYPKSQVDGYNLYIPDEYTTGSEDFPVIVFLQGGLAVGGEVDVIFNWELPNDLKYPTDLDSEVNQIRLNQFIYVMPHISIGQFYENIEALKSILTELSEEYRIDEDRIYLTGLSRGGHGTWGIASRMPEWFAAIAPICGAPHGISLTNNLVNIPIWTSHNTDDRMVPHRHTVVTVNRIEELSGEKFHRTQSIDAVNYEDWDWIFTSTPSKSHDAWSDMYDNPNFYKWLLKYKRAD